MTHALTAFRLAAIGAWSEEQRFFVDANRIAAYALATNDHDPSHVSGEIAPPLFAVVPVQETVGLGLTGPMSTIVPRDVMMTGLHSEHDLRVHQPIRPGMVVKVKAAPVGLRTKPRGTSLVVRFVCSDDDGQLLNEQYFKAVFRAAHEPVHIGEEIPDHRLADDTKAQPPVATFTQEADPDQTFRYAQASGDDMIVHLDDAAARSAGLPGIIIHGLCTMAFISQGLTAAVGGGAPRALRRLAVRFTHPLLPGQPFTTRVWQMSRPWNTASYGFESSTDDGQLIVKDGLAEFRPQD